MLVEFTRFFDWHFANGFPGVRQVSDFFESRVEVGVAVGAEGQPDERVVLLQPILNNQVLLIEELAPTLKKPVEQALKRAFDFFVEGFINRAGFDPLRFDFLQRFCRFFPVFTFGDGFGFGDEGAFDFEVFKLIHPNQLAQDVFLRVEPVEQREEITDGIETQQFSAELYQLGEVGAFVLGIRHLVFELGNLVLGNDEAIFKVIECFLLGSFHFADLPVGEVQVAL